MMLYGFIYFYFICLLIYSLCTYIKIHYFCGLFLISMFILFLIKTQESELRCNAGNLVNILIIQSLFFLWVLSVSFVIFLECIIILYPCIRNIQCKKGKKTMYNIFCQANLKMTEAARASWITSLCLCVSVSCSGRRGRLALTAKAPALHPGPLLVPERGHLWPGTPEGGGFLPPADPLPVCPIEQNTTPLSLSVSPTVPPPPHSPSPPSKSRPRALPRTDPGPPSSQLVVLSAVFLGVFRVWNVGALRWTRAALVVLGRDWLDVQSADISNWAVQAELHES